MVLEWMLLNQGYEYLVGANTLFGGVGLNDVRSVENLVGWVWF